MLKYISFTKLPLFQAFFFFVFSFLNTGRISAEAIWPKIIKTPKGDITVYQPTPEIMDGTDLSGRAAISVLLKDAKRPVFGAIWITGKLEVDRDTRIAVLKDIKIPNIKFPDDTDTTGASNVSKLIEEDAPNWKLELSMDDLITTLESANFKGGDSYKTDPPEIIIANKPSVLVIIDGKPILKEMKGYEFQKVENTPFFIVFDPKEKEYYMYGDRVWYTSVDITGTWARLKRTSSQLKKLQEDIEKANSQQSQTSGKEQVNEKEPETVPDIIVRTTPAELIVFNGEPQLTPITQTNLLYAKNTESNVFMDINSQSYYILITGRWYKSAELNGPWTFVEANKLPDEFKKIPEGSEKDEVLASVAGTEAAKEAILDTQIPQTAEVNRKTATVTVEYDGEPQFDKVDGTSMLYAVNSPQTVLKVGNTYYCVDNGIWFESTSAKGPWKVTDKRPEEVDQIEPSSSVYNVKYVYIYDSTPDVVYVGYTPGYYGTYIYGPTVIYGTGYPYTPWYGAYYYPRPVTYGFSMHYNPYYGWSMGFGVSYGPIHMSFGGAYHGGYYGCPGYHPPYHYPPPGGYYGHGGYPPGRYPGTGGGGYNPPNQGNRPGGPQVNPNIYGNNRAGVNPNISSRPSTGTGSGGRGPTASQQPKNNIFTDNSGNVYQKNNNGQWEQRQGNSWQSSDKAATRPSTGTGASTRPSTGTGSSAARPSTQPSSSRSDLDRQAASRDRGTTRTNNYSNYSSRPSAAPARSGGFSGGGGMRGGGGRR
jgi:hypothetical protein